MADEGVVHKEESAMNELMKQAEEAKSHDDMLFGGSTTFVQSEKKEKGIIKAAVVYSLKTSEDHSNHYGFLLAWSDYFNEGRNTRKVYGECGLLEKFQNIDWDKVEKDLDASTRSCSYIDAYTRTSVKADIAANVVSADFM